MSSTCHKCGAPVEETQAFCAQCGWRLHNQSVESGAEGETDHNPSWYETGWVWVWLIIIWPVGLYGLAMRSKPENRKWFWVAGAVILVLGVIGSEPPDTELTSNTSSRSGYSAQADPQNQLSTYAVILGRAVGCGINIQDESRKVGAWLDRTWTGKERAAYLSVITDGIEKHAKMQKNGNSPDTCSDVRREFRSVSWP